MPDVYATIAEADHDLQERLANVLELRAADAAQRAMLEDYTARLAPPPGSGLLEVGCGTGAICRFLTTLPGVDRVTGLDPSDLFVERPRELGGDLPLDFVTGDGRELPFGDEQFDAVVFHTSLCHMALVDRGADALAATGTAGPGVAAALKDEARERIANGSFFGHIAYTSALSRRPPQAAAATG